MAPRRSSDRLAVERRTVPTSVGDAVLHLSEATGAPSGTLVLGHGAGGGVDTPDLLALARTLPAAGLSVVRVEQPWHVAGRKVAGPPPTLDRAWLAALSAVDRAVPMVVGGRSAGARVACRTAAELGAAGVLALAFPLHPPGRPERSRLPELELPTEAGLPVLVLQGTRDTFGGPADIPAEAGRLVVPIDGGDHSFRVLKGGDQQGALARLVAVTQAWLAELLSPTPE
jgi:predicted alpha/beta-hydrolase family hydrolase